MAINTLFKNIADAIRAKTGSAGTLTPAQMPGAIANIQTGGYEAFHIWTKDASGNAQMYAQAGHYDFTKETPFTPTGEAEVIRFNGSTYTETQLGNICKLASYVDGSWYWGVYATKDVWTNSDSTRKAAGSLVRKWYYSNYVDFIVMG